MADSLICSVAGCDKSIHGRSDLCNMHYTRFRRHGDALATKRIARERSGPNHCGKADCPAATFLRKHVRYIKNVDVMKKKNKEWRADNLELVRKMHTEWYAKNKEHVRKKLTEWRAANPERVRQTAVNWSAANPGLRRSYAVKRRAREVQAMPSWLTQDHISQINSVYAEARRLSIHTGISHHVDHIVPLNGRTVCGLHVPWNLRAIPAIDNLRRPKIYTEGIS